MTSSALEIFPSWEDTRIHCVQFPEIRALQEGNVYSVTLLMA
jgi:hypothetical protein